MEKFIIEIQLACMLVSFLFSIPTINNRNMPDYMRGFYIYSLVALALTSLNLVNRSLHLIDSNFLMKQSIISIIFHYCFLSYFFYRIIWKRSFRVLIILLFTFFLGLIIYQVTESLSGNLNRYSYITANLVLIVFCILYYYQIMGEELSKNIFARPAFWVVTGIFMSMSPVIVFATFEKYLLINSSFDDYVSLVFVAGIAFGVLHLFLAKAYLCSVKYTNDKSIYY